MFDADIGVILQDKLLSDQLLAVVEAAVAGDVVALHEYLDRSGGQRGREEE